MAKGGTLTATYLDTENLNPGIPTDRTASSSTRVIRNSGARARTTGSSEELPTAPETDKPAVTDQKQRATGPEIVTPRRALSYAYVDAGARPTNRSTPCRRQPALRCRRAAPRARRQQRDQRLRPDRCRTQGGKASRGAIRRHGARHPQAHRNARSNQAESPQRLHAGQSASSPTNEPPLEEGRFSFAVPFILGDPPTRSFATKAAEYLPDSSLPDGLAVKAGDIVHVGYPVAG